MQHPDPIAHLHTNFDRLIKAAAGCTDPEKLEVCDQYTRCLTGIPHPLCNMIIPGDQTEEAFIALLEDSEKWNREHSMPMALVLFPSVGLAGRPELATQRNWIPLDNMPGMWMKLPSDFETGELAPGVSVRLADDVEALEAVSNILAEGYPLPLAASEFFMKGIHFAGEADQGCLANVIATFEGQPAACSSVCVRDGVAGIYCVATLERFRGRGLGTAVTRAAMKQGQILGATHALLHATAMGAPIYTKIGFSEECRILVYGFGL